MINKEHLFEIDDGITLPQYQSGFVAFGKSAMAFSNVKSQKITYSGSDVSSIEFYVDANQITENRCMKVEISYSAGNPTQEVWYAYDSDGITVVETRTVTYTYTNDEITSATEAVV